MASERLFKFFRDLDGLTAYGHSAWQMDGSWVEVGDGPLVECVHGLHLCRERDLIHHAHAVLAEVEHEGELVECDTKAVVRRARVVRVLDGWTERAQRLYAADMADSALVYARAEDRDMLAQVIETARQFALGTCTERDLSAAWSAAWNAAWNAARNAARSAAMSAAWNAAGSAARSAAWSAAWSAARSAAMSAAWSAAWSAARSAASSRLLAVAEGRITHDEIGRPSEPVIDLEALHGE